MRRKSLTALLAALAVMASGVAVTGCGGKSTTTSSHKQSTKPNY